MKPSINITGKKFNKLTAIKFHHKIGVFEYWVFKCECGREKVIRKNQVMWGVPKSCGCLYKLRIGPRNPHWKGDKVGYAGLHKWTVSRLGSPIICEHCGKKESRSRYIQWANKSRKYLRKIDDWLRLCAKCHYKYDRVKV